MTRPQVSYGLNGQVLMSVEINGMAVSMRFSADTAEELAAALIAMAGHARKAASKGAKLHELVSPNRINFDAQQVKEKAAGQRVQTETSGRSLYDEDGDTGA